MAKENDIIKQLIKTIDGSVNEFNSSIPKVQQDILKEVELLVKKLDLKSDSIQASGKNLRIIGELKNKINKILRAPEYKGLVQAFAKSFNEVSKLQNEYFRTVSKEYKPPKLLGQLQSQSVDATLNSLLESGIEVNIGSKIVEILRQNITGGAKYTDMVERLREYLTTTKAGDGALERYAKQITSDSLNQYSAQYLNVVSNDLGLEWYRYTGSEIETSRPFCKACLDKQFIHQSEIPDLLRGDFPEFKKEDGKINPKTKLPEGMIAGTNVENFHVYRGGWNCGHQLVPVSEDRVPDPVKAKVGLSEKKKQEVDFDVLKKNKTFNNVLKNMPQTRNDNDLSAALKSLANEELAAIRTYTGNEYKTLNNQLRGNTLDEYNKSLTNVAQTALRKLPNDAVGKYYRGAGLTPDQVAKYKAFFEIKRPFNEQTFFSASKLMSVARNFTNTEAGKSKVVFNVTAKSGKYISPVSQLPHEEEILFAPGTKFRVTGFEEKGKGYVINLEEV